MQYKIIEASLRRGKRANSLELGRGDTGCSKDFNGLILNGDGVNAW